jgi:hypothetical protein
LFVTFLLDFSYNYFYSFVIAIMSLKMVSQQLVFFYKENCVYIVVNLAKRYIGFNVFNTPVYKIHWQPKWVVNFEQVIGIFIGDINEKFMLVQQIFLVEGWAEVHRFLVQRYFNWISHLLIHLPRNDSVGVGGGHFWTWGTHINPQCSNFL